VSLLSEMPPTDYMDDQRAVTCLLGLNVNSGEEIKLRLRTNDLLGFRKYDKIRETLVHELTHNVWGDHDNNFKTLNSQLLRAVVRINNAERAAQSVLGRATEVCAPATGGRGGLSLLPW
jgi:WLM domain